MTSIRTILVIYDTESTGKDPADPKTKIASLGAIACVYNPNNRQYEELGRFHQYVKIDIKMPPGAQAVNHITDQMLAEQGVPFSDMMSRFASFIIQFFQKGVKTRTVLLAHNGKGYDDILLYNNCVMNKVKVERDTPDDPVPGFFDVIRCDGFIDSLLAFRAAFDNQPNSCKPCTDTGKVEFKLGTCYRSFCPGGQKHLGAHDAAVDCSLVLDCLNSPAIGERMSYDTMFQKHFIPRDTMLKNVKTRLAGSFRVLHNLSNANTLPISSPMKHTVCTLQPFGSGSEGIGGNPSLSTSASSQPIVKSYAPPNQVPGHFICLYCLLPCTTSATERTCSAPYLKNLNPVQTGRGPEMNEVEQRAADTADQVMAVN